MVQKNANPAHSLNSHRMLPSIIEQPCVNPFLFLSLGNLLFIRIYPLCLLQLSYLTQYAGKGSQGTVNYWFQSMHQGMHLGSGFCVKAMPLENLNFYLFGSREGEWLKKEKASDISVTVFYSVQKFETRKVRTGQGRGKILLGVSDSSQSRET